MGSHPVGLPLSWLSGVFLGTEDIDPVALAGHTVLPEFAVGVAVALSHLVDNRQPEGDMVDRPGGLGLAGTWCCYCTFALLEDGSVEGIGYLVSRQPVVIVSGMIEPHGPEQLLGQHELEPELELGLELEQQSAVGQAELVPPVHAACSEPQPAVAAGFRGREICWKNWSSGSWVVQMAQCTSAG